MASTNVQKENDLFEGQNLLYLQIFSYLRPMCLKWAIQLGIPDIIKKHGKPITLPELLSSLKVPPSKTNCVPRLMRFLVHNGIFDIHVNQKGHESYSLTPASELLVSGSDHCLSPVVTMFTDQVLMGVNHHLGEWVCGEVPTLFEVALGTSFWELVKKKPSYGNLFNEGMASDSRMVDLALRNCSSVFEGLDSIVDVGGGTGTTTKIISAKFSKLKCVVFDLPHVVANLLGSNNLSYVSGDMFISIPKADAVLLKWVLHDWSDEKCIEILKNCKSSVSSKESKGKVIIIDTVINEKEDDDYMTETKLCMDIFMLGLEGKERTEMEWKQLFIKAGFKHYKIFPIFGFRSLIEVYP